MHNTTQPKTSTRPVLIPSVVAAAAKVIGPVIFKATLAKVQADDVKRNQPPVLEKIALQMRKDKNKTYVVRIDGKPNTFSIGEVVVPGVVLFRKGFYNLKREMAEKLASLVGVQFPYPKHLPVQDSQTRRTKIASIPRITNGRWMSLPEFMASKGW